MDKLNIGGYQIIDFKNNDFETYGNKYFFKDSYKKINSTKKPILITNFLIDGIKYNSVFVNLEKQNNGDYKGTLSFDIDYEITFYTNDNVEII